MALRPWTYIGCRGPGSGPSGQARRLLAVVRELDPHGRSLGIFNPRRIAGSRTWSLHACGRALDWAPSSFNAGQSLNHQLVQRADELDLQLIIWNRQQFGGRHGRVFAPYHGADPHTSHLHIEVRP